MKKFSFFLMAAFALAVGGAMVACSKEQEDPTPDERIPINISIGQETRTNGTSFSTDDEIGVYVVNYTDDAAGSLATEGNYVDNMRFTYEDGIWTPDEDIFWQDKTTPADFYVYYPYGTPTNVAAYPFSVSTDQSTSAKFNANDFLWGKAENVNPTKSAVPITVSHAFSLIEVYVYKGNGFGSSEWSSAEKSVAINNIKTEASIDLATGEVSVTGTTNSITPYLTNSTSALSDTENPSSWPFDECYVAMIAPQTVPDGTKLITVTVDGDEYSFSSGFTFEPNTIHTFSITVNKSEGGVEVSIDSWQRDETIHKGNAE